MTYYYRYLLAGDIATKAALDDREPLSAVKPVNQTVNNTTTHVSDTALTLSLAANAVYHVSAVLSISGPSAADFRSSWTVPTGTTGTRLVQGPPTGVTSARDTIIHDRAASLTTVLGYGTDGSEDSAVREECWVLTAGTSGSMTLTWAQFTATVGTTRVRAGSWMRARRVA